MELQGLPPLSFHCGLPCVLVDGSHPFGFFLWRKSTSERLDRRWHRATQAISALVAAGNAQLFDDVSATPQPTGARYTPSSTSNSTGFFLVQTEFSPCDEILCIFMLPNENARKYLVIAHARTTHVHAPASETVCRLSSFPNFSLERSYYILSPSIAQRL